MAPASFPPLDILILAPVALPGGHGIGGVQRIVSRQARWLAGRGHRVRVVTSAHPSGIASLTDGGVEYVFLNLDKGLGRTTGQVPFTVSRWRAATVAAWPALLAAGVPDVVHGHAEAELGLVAAGLIGRDAPLPALSTLYGSTLSGMLDHIRLAGGLADRALTA